jgi:dynein heavy chain
MLRYEKSRFAAWSAGVEAAVTAGLKQAVLCRQEQGPPASQPDSTTAASPGSSGSVAINFPPGLLRAMREAKYLDQLGFAVPPAAVNLALQEGQVRWAGAAGWLHALPINSTGKHGMILARSLREHFHSLEAMLEGHRRAVASLTTAERALLVEQAAALDAALEPGLSRINWTSLTIPLFVADVNKVGGRRLDCWSESLVWAALQEQARGPL